jgi:hypothetical protein
MGKEISQRDFLRHVAIVEEIIRQGIKPRRSVEWFLNDRNATPLLLNGTVVFDYDMLEKELGIDPKLMQSRVECLEHHEEERTTAFRKLGISISE